MQLSETKDSEQTWKGDGNVKLHPRIYQQNRHISSRIKGAFVLRHTTHVIILLESVYVSGRFS